jgi:aryl-alcohol dehydrogenase-like predicted oxidoreductase
VVCVQNRYSLDDQGHDPVLRACAERSVAFVPFFAIAGNRRQSGGGGTDSAALLEVARRQQATPAQVRLAWTLHQGPHVLAIPGTGDPGHLEQNVAAAAIRLSAEELALLSQ